ncbi:hypothetical protein LCGC14_0608560 [marine sediment metagenome]|uniref:Band 7 domain-containing protein n=1 Tax=marine sediment metagenome TaxID=412755 RepID=A0A0F9UGU9_9ZZZZ
MTLKRKLLLGAVAIVVVALTIAAIGGIGYNADQNWQFVQGIWGTVRDQDRGGYYFRKYATVWTYPRYMEFIYNDVKNEGADPCEATRITFNDGGTARVETFVRIMTPIDFNDRREFHRQFGGASTEAGRMQLVKNAVGSFMIDCLKTTASLMSSSEHQAARKGEFKQVAELQLSNGLYVMESEKRQVKDVTDEEGKMITIDATRIILGKDGLPLIKKPSPLTQDYKIKIVHFSVTGTNYSEITREQFVAKQKSFLNAELSKAERKEMVQERLKIEERGRKDKADMTAIANVIKAKAVIAAQQLAEVAAQRKVEKETVASMNLEIAKIKKTEAETLANQMLAVATINLSAAKKDAARIIELAKAEQERIQLAGAITEKDRVLATIKAERDVKIAIALAVVKSPLVVMVSSGGAGEKEDVMNNLINIRLLQGAGIIPNKGQFGEILPIPMENLRSSPTSK